MNAFLYLAPTGITAMPKSHYESNYLPRRGFLKQMGLAGGAAWLGSRVGRVLGADAPAVPVAPKEAAPVGGTVPKRPFGRTKEMISCIGFGGETFARAASEDESIRMVHEALDHGVNFMDNAWEYNGGRSEELMGKALAGGWRDKAFLMTKVCTHGQGKDFAMDMLEKQLRRLQTDRLDLWQIHAIGNQREIDSAFSSGGVVEALELAKKQGKVRYVGFTGHTSPDLHFAMLQHGYHFDSVQMPLSAFDAGSAASFQHKVLPELQKQGTAALAMKSLCGNGKPMRDGVASAEEMIRYSLSLPVVTVILGMDSLDFLRQNIRTAQNAQPLKPEEMQALEGRCRVAAGRSRYEWYKRVA